MTSSQRFVVGLVALLILLSGIWLWSRLPTSSSPTAPTVPPTGTRVATAVATTTPVRPPPGYRLAGIAVGEPESFAVIEAPNGAHALYRRGDDVPGLGRLDSIEAERVVVSGDAGQFDLWLAPAATPTATTARPSVRTSSPARRTPKPSPRRPPAGGTAPESTP